MYCKTADVAGLRLFYREAGDPSKPTIVLLHGFPEVVLVARQLVRRSSSARAWTADPPKRRVQLVAAVGADPMSALLGFDDRFSTVCTSA